MDHFFTYTKDIRETLKTFLEAQKELHKDFVWGEDAFTKLISFCQSGKAVRGNSILLIASEDPSFNPANILPIAAAMELFHASLLIQDDVTDQDMLRRGKPSMQAQFMTQTPNPHTAESMAFYVADIGIFLSYRLVSEANVSDTIKQKVISLFSQELANVALGQMQDVYVPGGKPTKETVLQTYRTKTARYTFSLPFMIGALCAQLPDQIQNQLAAFGEHLGTIFQLQDDTIGLFGNEEEIGKPVGSDIREGKYTFHVLSLLEKISPEEKNMFDTVFANEGATREQLDALMQLFQRYDIQEQILKQMKDEAMHAEEIQKNLTLLTHANILEELLAYNLKRTY